MSDIRPYTVTCSLSTERFATLAQAMQHVAALLTREERHITILHPFAAPIVVQVMV